MRLRLRCWVAVTLPCASSRPRRFPRATATRQAARDTLLLSASHSTLKHPVRLALAGCSRLWGCATCAKWQVVAGGWQVAVHRAPTVPRPRPGRGLRDT